MDLDELNAALDEALGSVQPQQTVASPSAIREPVPTVSPYDRFMASEPVQRAAAGAIGLGRALSFGLSDRFARTIDPEAAQAMKSAEINYPGTMLLGELAGTVAPAGIATTAVRAARAAPGVVSKAVPLAEYLYGVSGKVLPEGATALQRIAEVAPKMATSGAIPGVVSGDYEKAALGSVLGGAIPIAGEAIRPAVRFGKYLTKALGVGETPLIRAGQRLQEAGETATGLQSKIGAASKTNPTFAGLMTTAEVADNPVLAGLEQNVAAKQKQAEAALMGQENRRAINTALKDVGKAVDKDPDKTGKFLISKFEDLKRQYSEEYSKLYDQRIVKELPTSVFTSVKKAINTLRTKEFGKPYKATTKIGTKLMQPPGEPDELRSIYKYYFNKENLTTKDLWQMRKQLNDKWGAYHREGKDNLARYVANAKELIDGALSKSKDPAVKAANAKYREYALLFKEGPLASLLAGKKLDEKAVDMIMNSQAAARQFMDVTEKMVPQARDAARKAVRDQMVSDYKLTLREAGSQASGQRQIQGDRFVRSILFGDTTANRQAGQTLNDIANFIRKGKNTKVSGNPTIGPNTASKLNDVISREFVGDLFDTGLLGKLQRVGYARGINKFGEALSNALFYPQKAVEALSAAERAARRGAQFERELGTIIPQVTQEAVGPAARASMLGSPEEGTIEMRITPNREPLDADTMTKLEQLFGD